MKKKVAALVLAAVMAVGVTSCGNKETGTNTTEPAQTGETGTQASGEEAKEGVDMKFWIFLDPTSTEDPRSVVLKSIVDEYNATNEYGNTVTVESFNYSEFEAQAIQAAAAGTGPDIINCFSDQLKQHIDAKTVQPMTAYAADFIDEMGDYIHTAEKLKQEDGEVYSLPWESRVTVMWYRGDVYENAPAGWEELLATGSQASTDLAVGMGLGLSEGGNGAGLIETFIPWLRSCGGDFLDAEGKAVFNSDAGVQTVEYIKSLVEEGAMDQSMMNMAYDDIVDGFKSGTVLAMNAGTQRSATIMGSDLSEDFKSCPMPGAEGKPAPAYVAGQTLAIGQYAQDPDMAFDFIKFFLSGENQVKWVGANCLPVRTGVYEDASVKENPMYDSMVMWSDYATTGEITFYPADYTELCTNLVKAVQNVCFNGADAKTELDAVVNWYNTK